MTIEELIADELDKSGPLDLAGLPLEVELDKKGSYSISGPLPKVPRSDETDDLQVTPD